MVHSLKECVGLDATENCIIPMILSPQLIKELKLERRRDREREKMGDITPKSLRGMIKRSYPKTQKPLPKSKGKARRRRSF